MGHPRLWLLPSHGHAPHLRGGPGGGALLPSAVTGLELEGCLCPALLCESPALELDSAQRVGNALRPKSQTRGWGWGRRSPRKKKIFKTTSYMFKVLPPEAITGHGMRTPLSPPVQAAVFQGTPGSSRAGKCRSGCPEPGHNETTQFQLCFMMLHRPYCSVQREDVH